MRFLRSAVIVSVASAALIGMASGAVLSGEQTSVKAATPKEAGRYLVVIGGCNDCHSPGWNESNGKLPVDRWLLGSNVGFHGPWGTSYPSNLRLVVSHMSEAQWLDMIRTRDGHPPMPWANLRALSTTDQRAIYAFIKSLGPAGQAAPAYLPPTQTPKTPVIEFVPHGTGAPTS